MPADSVAPPSWAIDRGRERAAIMNEMDDVDGEHRNG
jgi:hypothetical protein